MMLGSYVSVYAVVARASADERVVLLTGMALVVCVETGFALWERFILGQLQTVGSNLAD